MALSFVFRMIGVCHMNHRSFVLAILLCIPIMLNAAQAGLLPERVEKAAQKRIADGRYRTLVFAVVDGDKSQIEAFGKLSDGKHRMETLYMK